MDKRDAVLLVVVVLIFAGAFAIIAYRHFNNQAQETQPIDEPTEVVELTTTENGEPIENGLDNPAGPWKPKDPTAGTKDYTEKNAPTSPKDASTNSSHMTMEEYQNRIEELSHLTATPVVEKEPAKE